MKIRIGFIGTGLMAEAFIAGLLGTHKCSAGAINTSDVNGERLEHIQHKYQVNIFASNEDLVINSDVVILAVKPQNLVDVLLSLKDIPWGNKLIISLVAGFSIDTLYKYIPRGAAVARAMSNTPCLIGKGVTVISFSQLANEDQQEIALNIMEAVGHVHILPEKLIDAVTGLSGSGPAYIFLVIEALIDAGVRAGLPREISRDLAVQTMIGAATMVDKTKTHPAILKDQVTTPGGTTIAALHVLEGAGTRVAFMDAVNAAVKRSKELGLE